MPPRLPELTFWMPIWACWPPTTVGTELEQGAAVQDLEAIASRGGNVCRQGEGRRIQR